MLVASLAETWRFLRILDSCCSRKRKEKAGLQMPESACFAELQLLPDLLERARFKASATTFGIEGSIQLLIGVLGLMQGSSDVI